MPIDDIDWTCGGRLNELCGKIERWRRAKGFETGWRNVPEKLMLIVSECAEAMEAYRRLPPELIEHLANGNTVPVGDGLSAYVNFREELADTAIRLFDLARSLGCDLEQDIAGKMQFNIRRPHKHGKER